MMSDKLTLKEYAKKKGISLVTVNKHINKGLINSIKEGNRRYIILDEDIDNSSVNKVNKVYKPYENNFINHLQRENKRLIKENKKLKKLLIKKEKQLVKTTNNEKQTLLNYIGELKQLQLSNKPKKDEEIIINETKKKKKKSKKKEGKKSK